jgi:hypothetical protein
MRHRALTVYLILAVAAACGTSATAADSPHGTFALTSVDGRPLPLHGAQTDTTSGQLVFAGGDTVRETIVATGRAVPGQPVLNTTTLDILVRIQASPLLILRSTTSGVTDTATVAGNTITIAAHAQQSTAVQSRVYVQ